MQEVRGLTPAETERPEGIVNIGDREIQNPFAGDHIDPSVSTIHQNPSLRGRPDLDRIRITSESRERGHNVNRNPLGGLCFQEAPRSYSHKIAELPHLNPRSTRYQEAPLREAVQR